MNRHDPRVRRILRDLGLLSGAPLGRGNFSLVYASERPGRVIKLTADRSTARYLAAGLPGPHVPVCHRAPEIVGMLDDIDVYRIEMERLVATAAASPARRLARQVHAAHCRLRASNEVGDPARLFAHLPASLRDLMGHILQMTSLADDVGLDLAPRNMMQRADGTLVVTDPVFDRRLAGVAYRQLGSTTHGHYRSGRAFYQGVA